MEISGMLIFVTASAARQTMHQKKSWIATAWWPRNDTVFGQLNEKHLT